MKVNTKWLKTHLGNVDTLQAAVSLLISATKNVSLLRSLVLLSVLFQSITPTPRENLTPQKIRKLK